MIHCKYLYTALLEAHFAGCQDSDSVDPVAAGSLGSYEYEFTGSFSNSQLFVGLSGLGLYRDDTRYNVDVKEKYGQLEKGRFFFQVKMHN